MAEDDSEVAEPPRKKSKLPFVIGLALAVVLGGAGFYLTYSGALDGGHPDKTHASGHEADQLTGSIAFVKLDPLIISLGPAASNRHLKFAAQLEVPKEYADEVTVLVPRFLDVLNGYLRAIELSEIENPSSLIRLRAQMLRRVQTVAGDGRVRDLLVTEFVVN